MSSDLDQSTYQKYQLCFLKPKTHCTAFCTLLFR